MRTKTSITLLALSVLVLNACMSEAKVQIIDPPRGSMLPAGQDVTIQVKFEGDEVVVGDETLTGGGTRTVTLPPVDGLGFVSAKIPGDPLFDVRSYIQGEYQPADDWNDETISIGVGGGPLNTDTVSLAGLVADLLTNEELEQYVDEPLTVSVTIIMTVTANVYVDSVISSDVEMTFAFDGDALTFAATLNDVEVEFRAEAAGAFTSVGTAHYEWIDVTGTVELTEDTVLLTNVQTDYPDPTITSNLPTQAVTPVLNLLNAEIPAAVANAAQNAADAVFPHLVSGLRPTVSVDFPEPITQDVRPSRLTVSNGRIGMGYETLIQAETPSVAASDHGVLQRVATDAVGGAGLSVLVGSALVNQIAFAVWDAGNTNGLVFTEAELNDLGMPALDSPYDNLNEAEVSLLLPPLLEWRADGPYLDVGGIEIRIDVANIDDSTAWTAASVPVRLVLVTGGLRIEVDPDRDIILRDVAFDRMSDLADQDKVLGLLGAAVPGVVGHVFGELPTITLNPIPFSRLDGSDGPILIPEVNSVTPQTDTWLLDVSLSIQ